MRTTIRFDGDVSAAIRALQRKRGIGVSAAANELARRGLVSGGRERTPFEQEASDLGLRIDVSNVAEALERIERD